MRLSADPLDGKDKPLVQTLRELLVSLAFGLVLAAIAFLARVLRARKDRAVEWSWLVEHLRVRMADLRESGRIPDHRRLTDRESELLEYFLCRATVKPSPFCDQVHRAVVESKCSCGCPSIDVRIDGMEQTTGQLYPLVEYWWRDATGRRHGVFPVGQDSRLVGLQVYSFEGSEHPRELPAIAELQAFAV